MTRTIRCAALAAVAAAELAGCGGGSTPKPTTKPPDVHTARGALDAAAAALEADPRYRLSAAIGFTRTSLRAKVDHVVYLGPNRLSVLEGDVALRVLPGRYYLRADRASLAAQPGTSATEVAALSGRWLVADHTPSRASLAEVARFEARALEQCLRGVAAAGRVRLDGTARIDGVPATVVDAKGITLMVETAAPHRLVRLYQPTRRAAGCPQLHGSTIQLDLSPAGRRVHVSAPVGARSAVELAREYAASHPS